MIEIDHASPCLKVVASEIETHRPALLIYLHRNLVGSETHPHQNRFQTTSSVSFAKSTQDIGEPETSLNTRNPNPNTSRQYQCLAPHLHHPLRLLCRSRNPRSRHISCRVCAATTAPAAACRFHCRASLCDDDSGWGRERCEMSGRWKEQLTRG
ncbi:uncharacterized protein BKA78DRAFT_150137 [Phyllosticta capitalensis]|uniref:uncharacterized protein n=1 Tax=Phyllosticta capitalensis TaxID=121624 RepID=UPI00312E3534